MRYFKGLLNFSHPEAARRVAFLHKRLDDAAAIQSGCQQHDVSLQDLAEMEDAVADLAAALLGRKVILAGSAGFHVAGPLVPRDFIPPVDISKYGITTEQDLAAMHLKAAQYDQLLSQITETLKQSELGKISMSCRAVVGDTSFYVSPEDRALFNGEG